MMETTWEGGKVHETKVEKRITCTPHWLPLCTHAILGTAAYTSDRKNKTNTIHWLMLSLFWMFHISFLYDAPKKYPRLLRDAVFARTRKLVESYVFDLTKADKSFRSSSRHGQSGKRGDQKKNLITRKALSQCCFHSPSSTTTIPRFFPFSSSLFSRKWYHSI